MFKTNKIKMIEGSKMSKKIMLKNVRLSFPSIFAKATFEGTEGKYEATFLIPKDDTKTKQMLDDAIAACIAEHKLGKVKGDKLALKDGDDSEYDGYEDNWSLKASNNKRPTVIGKDKAPLTEEDEVMYAGCYVNVIIEPWAQNNNYGKRVNFNLLGLQFVKDGESFGDAGSSASVDDFEEIDDEDEY